MNFTLLFVIAAVLGYLLGSFNTSIVVSKLLLHQDIRTMGSGNAGLTNTHRCMGRNATILVLAGDILKTAVAVLITAALFGRYALDYVPVAKLVCGLFVVAGHMFPLYFGFKGGKGVLAGAALCLLFNWQIFCILLVVFVLIVAATRYISLGSIVVATAFPFMTLAYYCYVQSPSAIPCFVLTLIIGGSVVYMHRSNIKRLLSGTENKFSFHKKK